MFRNAVALFAAAAFAASTIAPAEAQERGGYYERHGEGYGDHRGYDHRGYDHRRRGHRGHDDDDGDAVAAGVIGLVLGLAIGAAASQPREQQARCYDNYQRCEPPRGYDDRGYDDRGYYDQGYGPSSYDPSGYDPRYQQDNPLPPPCTRRERQWDRYANRYVFVDTPC